MAKKITKAEELLNVLQHIQPGKAICWPIYDGNDIQDAKMVEDYVTVFFRSGDLMPIPNTKYALNVSTVRIEHNDLLNTHSIVVEGIVRKIKGELK